MRSSRDIAAHLKYLSDDLFEGRAPSTRGGQLAAAYLAVTRRAAISRAVMRHVFQNGRLWSRRSIRHSRSQQGAHSYPDQVVEHWVAGAEDCRRARSFVGHGIIVQSPME
jgi:hypothetical protein